MSRYRRHSSVLSDHSDHPRDTVHGPEVLVPETADGHDHRRSIWGTEQGGEEGAEDALKRVLAIHAAGPNNLAAAYYDPETQRMQVLEDTKDTWGWDMAILLVEQFFPDEVIMSAGAPDALVDEVEKFCTSNPTTKLIFLPHKQFSHMMAVYHLASVRLPRNAPSVMGDSGEAISWSSSGRNPSNMDDVNVTTPAANDELEEQDAGMGKIRLSLLKMGCRVNVHAPYAVCAAGALLSHIIRTQATELRPADESGIDLAGIDSMDLEHHMLINHDALTSLAIIDVEAHAFMHAKKQNQALSLSGVLNTTVTPLGRKLFHTWLLRPLIDVDRINARLNAVQLLAAKDVAQPRKLIKKELKRVRNLVAVCRKIKGGRARWKDWQDLVEALTAAFQIKESLTVFSLRGRVEVVEKLSKSLHQDVHLFLLDIVKLIDWDMSRDEERVCIRSMIDDELDQWREEYARLAPLLNQMGRVMFHRVPVNMCQHVNVVYLPQLGCLVAAHEVLDPAKVPDDWEQQFNTPEVSYFKTPEMHNLDTHYGDLHNIIMDREIEWVQRLIERIDDVHDDIVVAAEGLAELDCLIAFAEAVDRFDLRRPVMKEEPTLKIRKGFHPLHAMCTSPYIDNDTVLEGGGEGDKSSMMIVTGANGSGKSAYGKQVALIVFMAHIGCFVPAESAEIGICDKIFTRVHTRESASKTGSAFMIDLSQVSQALRGATSRSLLIVDEFGKGTASSDGAGLLAGVITYLLNGPCPRTVILTHYHELFAQQFLDPQLAIIYCHMQSILAEDSKQLTYLFKLTPTLSKTSNAAECALAHGIPGHVVARARYVSDCISKFQLTKLIDDELTAEDMAELEAAEELAKRFLTWEIDEEGIGVLDELEELLADDDAEYDKAEVEVVERGEGGAGVVEAERMAADVRGGDYEPAMEAPVVHREVEVIDATNIDDDIVDVW